MADSCKSKNPLQRSGVNQQHRVLNALLPASVKLDEREYADLILFAKNYAEQLKFFNSNDVEDGDWKVLMSMDVSVTLASLIRIDVQKCYRIIDQLFANVQDTSLNFPAYQVQHPLDTTEDFRKVNFKFLFDFAFSITQLLDDYYDALPGDFDYKRILGSAIQSNLPEFLDRLLKYYRDAVTLNLIDDADTTSMADEPFEMTLAQDFTATQLTGPWIDSSIPLFTPTFNGTSLESMIVNTCSHNLFRGIFDAYLKTLTAINQSAAAWLEKTLVDFPTHTPHYALYLTFIKLFRYAQDHLNGFTARHLDLYYKEILQLSNKPAEADKVHLVFELAKHVENHLVAKDTIFKAGKDIEGKEIFYSLTDDLVFNKGSVKAVKNIFAQQNITNQTKKVFAGTIANSEDGNGAKLESADKSWKTFGDPNKTPDAQTGFIIASHYLYLHEGKRTITFGFFSHANETIPFSIGDVQGIFFLQLTGEKGWIDVGVDSANITVGSNYFSIEVTIGSGEGAIVPYSQKLHQHNFKVELPMAKFVLKNADAREGIWNFLIDKVAIGVMAEGLKDLSIENDEGVLNPSKPFNLFGSSPHIGSSFILGSKELFLKTMPPKNTDVITTIKFTWDNYTELFNKLGSNRSKYTVDIRYIYDGQWMEFSPVKNPSLFPGQPSVLGFSLPALKVPSDFTKNKNFSVESKWGFLRLQLSGSEFGHSTYAQDLATEAKKAIIKTTPTTPSNGGSTTTTVSITPVPEPYTPKVKEIELNYYALTYKEFSNYDESTFIHLTPFGYETISENKDGVSLFPPNEVEGQLFIGIENFTPDQRLSLLFQVAEGSADPLAEKQEMNWYFLGRENKWIQFKNQDIADETNDLTHSGIIRFNISDEATSENTVMTEQLYWLRATVAKKTSAVCKLIEVVAQAAKAQFVDYRDEGNYFKSTLTSNSISKLVVSDAAIKKISQPYAAFNGRGKESDKQFYMRVSERLRHKHRGITMWDYERMVLEQFPSIYKVKCINHTRVMERSLNSQTIYTDNEIKPGYTLVVPMPDLQNKNAFDPLRPYTSLGLMTEIRQYLYQFISPHVNLEVRNPRFEEIQLEFKAKFMTAENNFYSNRLKLDIEKFMAPWAYNPESDIEFGGKINKSTLIDFIDERTYVDYITDVRMYHIADGVKSGDVEEAVASSSRSVIVSVKENDGINSHKISFITD